MSIKHFDINVHNSTEDGRARANVYLLNRAPGADTWTTDTTHSLADFDLTDEQVDALGLVLTDDVNDWHGTDSADFPPALAAIVAPTIVRLRQEA